jgi:Zn-dependent metalloprotease
MLPESATFSLARAATIQAARDLYGAGSDVESACIQAWNAVGVY